MKTKNDKARVTTDPRQTTQPIASDFHFEPYIDKRTVARLLGRSLRLLACLMKDPEFPRYKWDWRIAFRWSEVQAYMARRHREPAAAGAKEENSR